MGSIAVQVAKWKGAHVIGTASGRSQGLLRELGVDEPIDYEKTRFEDVVHEVDVVLDTLGGDTQNRSWKALKKGGILVRLLLHPQQRKLPNMVCARLSCLGTPVLPLLSEIAKLVDAGKLKPVVETVLGRGQTRRPT